MEFLRTPEERFDALEGFPYAPHYVEMDGARVHYVDEGEGEVVLMLHGEPTWSYLYRKMIAPLSRDHRVIAPDFLGFGRSDKPARVEDYSAKLHVDTMLRFLEKLDLTNVTLVAQDWGGLIGLPVVAEAPDRFSRLVLMNTFLPDGTHPMPESWLKFHDFVKNTPDLPVGFLVSRGCVQDVSEDVFRAYDAPFPGPEFKAGARAFPLMVPTNPDMEAVPYMRRARAFLKEWTKPAITLFSDSDPITRGGDAWFRKLIPSAAKEPEVTIRGAGHFLQEDKGEEIADHVAAFVKRNPL